MTTVRTDFNLNDAIAVLARTPASLTALLDGLPSKWTSATEGEGTWSPYDVIGHLVHGERVNWMPRIRQILEGREGPFPEFDRTAQFKDSAGRSLSELLTTFAELRRETFLRCKASNLLQMTFCAPVSTQRLARCAWSNCWGPGRFTTSTTSHR